MFFFMTNFFGLEVVFLKCVSSLFAEEYSVVYILLLMDI